MRLFRRRLLAWFQRGGRTFFWREKRITPYEALVTEILLTKTRAELVATIAPLVLERYATPEQLRSAVPHELERLLYPLGLHRKRTAGLIACAKVIVDELGDRVPTSVARLLELPSVGLYAASAIACVVADEPVAVLDANVSRVYQRYFSLPTPPPRLSAAHELLAFSQRVLPRKSAKMFNWAILDLGGTICTAKIPACERCPLTRTCDKSGVPSRSPRTSTVGIRNTRRR